MLSRYAITTCSLLFAACTAHVGSDPPAPVNTGGGGGGGGETPKGQASNPQGCIDPNADCNGDPDCEACMTGPTTCNVGQEWWAGGSACVCSGDPNALGCQVGECCGDGEFWDYTQCACLPDGSVDNAPPTGPTPPCLTNDGIDCGSDMKCSTCVYTGECADGPDPVYYNGTCYCFDGPSEPGCQIGYCCGAGFTWDSTQCNCVAN
jgi:hypothetical protein